MPACKLAYLVTHPIQYQAPLLRTIARDPAFDLTVFFCSDRSLRAHTDAEFGAVIQWDVPLLEGYRHEFLPALGSTGRISFWRPFNYGLRRRLRRGGFEVLWIHGYARWYHWAAMAAAKSLGLRVLIRDEATSTSARRGRWKRAAKQLFFRALGRCCDGFLAIGSRNREYYRSCGVPENKLFLVPYAVDNERFRREAAAPRAVELLRRRLRLRPERPVILYVGKLEPRKRITDLVEAYRRLTGEGAEPFPYLVIAGEGELRGWVEKAVEDTGWNSIRLLGFCGQRELPHYYALCDVFVLPAIREPWGLVVNEAMNAARPVIVSDQVGCAPDLVRSGDNGYVFAAGDVGALQAALIRILEDRGRAVEMGARSLDIINQWGFDQDVVGLRQAIAGLRHVPGQAPRVRAGNIVPTKQLTR